MGRQADRQAGRQTDRQAGRQAGDTEPQSTGVPRGSSGVLSGGGGNKLRLRSADNELP